MSKRYNKFFIILSLFLLMQLMSCSGYSIYMINFSQDVLDYGKVNIDTHSDIDLIVTNKGNVDRNITDISITGVDAEDFEIVAPNSIPTEASPFISPKKDSVTITVRFHSSNPIGERTASFHMQYGKYEYTKSLKAYAEPIPIFEIDKNSHDFGDVSRKGDCPADFFISNPGGKDLEITSLSFTGDDAGEFAISVPSQLPDTDNPLVVVKGGGQIKITANFRPDDPLGKKYSTLVIVHNATGSPTEIPLEGNTVKNSTLAIVGEHTRIYDPKLPDAGEAEFSYVLGELGVVSEMTITALKGTTVSRTIFTGKLTGKADPYSFKWNGKDDNGRYVDPGEYTIRVEALAGLVAKIEYTIDIIRLGIRKIAALDNGGDNEFQMVYFMRGTSQQFTQTPATGEFSMAKGGTIISDLDKNDGTPKDIPALHTDLKSYPMDNYSIQENDYNLPICYLRGSTPKFDVTLADSATSNISKTAKTCNYPVTGFDIRMVCESGGASLATNGDEDNQPGETLTYITNNPLPDYVGKFNYTIDWTWQYRVNGTSTWIDIPGKVSVETNVYTILDTPYFPQTGTQYAPWVKTVDDVARWCDKHVSGNVDTLDELYVAVDHGFFLDAGSNGSGDYCYDCNPGSGATHYVNYTTAELNLSGFYNLTNGKRINCTDCATLSCCIYNMVGATNVQRVRLGSMQLNAIEGIGWQQFTLSLWGSSHGFSYHHVCTTSTSMEYILDDCMNLDIDGNPYALPGSRGWNDPRIWTGTSGYDYLSATNSVTRTLDGKHSGIR